MYLLQAKHINSLESGCALSQGVEGVEEVEVVEVVEHANHRLVNQPKVGEAE